MPIKHGYRSAKIRSTYWSVEGTEQGRLNDACDTLLSCAYLNHLDDGIPLSQEMLKGVCALAQCLEQRGIPDQAVKTLEQAVARTQVIAMQAF